MSEQWIDVSAHQGVIDWPRVAASGIKGAIIRAGYGNSVSQQDKRFTANVKGAIAAGLKAAVYYFSYADSAADARKEWAVCRQIIAPYRAKILFVCYDYEYDSVGYYKRIHGAAPSKALINQTVGAFLSAAKADGLKTALYTNNDYRRNIFTTATLNAWDYLWLADYTGGPDIPCAIQQTTSSGRVPGISGSVDLDTAFTAIGTVPPPYTVDTTTDVTIEPGQSYTVKTTGDIQLVPGTAGRVQIVRCIQQGYILWHIVPIGKPGEDVGIYPQGRPKKLFTVTIR